MAGGGICVLTLLIGVNKMNLSNFSYQLAGVCNPLYIEFV